MINAGYKVMLNMNDDEFRKPMQLRAVYSEEVRKPIVRFFTMKSLLTLLDLSFQK